MQADAGTTSTPRLLGGVIVGILGVAVLVLAAVVAYNTLLNHGTTCASGGGPASCRPAGGFASPARIVIGVVFSVPIAAGGVVLLRSALDIARGDRDETSR